MKASVVIPVYNEESTVRSLVDKVESVLSNMQELIQSWEIVIVEDGSKDNTRHIIENISKEKPNVRSFYQPKNMGKGAAIRRGFKETTGDLVIVQDADLEYDPNEYSKLFSLIIDGKADAVYGSRFKGAGSNRVLYFWHTIGNRFLTLFSNMMTDLNLTDMETCYKVFRGDLIRSMRLESNRFGIEPEITAKLSKDRSLRIYEVPISYYGRTYAEGKKIGWKDGVSAIWCIIKFNLIRSKKDSFLLLPAENKQETLPKADIQHI